MNNTRVVGILGGMGPAAGADFVRLFVQACADHMRALQIPVSDQAFPEHWLAQVPVPDRSIALASPGPGGPLAPMLQAMGQLSVLGATAVAVVCNTAHAWHGELQARFPQLEVLHVANEVAQALASRGIPEVGLLATEGTYRASLYSQALQQTGVKCHVPLPEERERLMQGIYDGVKAGNMALAQDCFAGVAKAMALRHGLSTLILGCTEIPLALSAVPEMDELELMDPAVLLANVLAQRAYAAVQARPLS